jgi:hypothetical protein
MRPLHLVAVLLLALLLACDTPTFGVRVTVINRDLQPRYLVSDGGQPWVQLLRPNGGAWFPFWLAPSCDEVCSQPPPFGEVLVLHPDEEIELWMEGNACAPLHPSDVRGNCAALPDLDPMVAASVRNSAAAYDDEGEPLDVEGPAVRDGRISGDASLSLTIFTLPEQTEVQVALP